MTRHETIQVGMDRFRIGAWHADQQVAYVAPAAAGIGPSRAGVEACIARLQLQGYRGAITSALREFEITAFLNAGFEPSEALHVLRLPLRPSTMPRTGVTTPRTRRARRTDQPSVLLLDAAAFDPTWQLDTAGLIEAVEATPTSRFRVVGSRPIIGYAICGRAESTGYLQRLAVHPDQARRGIGSILVHDAARWLDRRGAREMLVNTQEGNATALAFYQSLGFVPIDEMLHVLRSTW